MPERYLLILNKREVLVCIGDADDISTIDTEPLAVIRGLRTNPYLEAWVISLPAKLFGFRARMNRRCFMLSALSAEASYIQFDPRRGKAAIAYVMWPGMKQRMSMRKALSSCQ